MRAGRSALSPTLALTLLVACATEPGRAKDVKPWAPPNAGSYGPFGVTDASPTDAGGTVGFDAASALPDAPIPSPPDPALEIFDPNEMYLFGTLSVGTCWANAIAPVASPNGAIVGFDCDTNGSSLTIRPSDGRLLYSHGGASGKGVYVFHNDRNYVTDISNYPDHPLANDDLVSFPPCEDGVGARGFLISPSSELLHACTDAMTWHEQSGRVLPDAEYASFGPERSVLSPSGILMLDTMEVVPITGLPAMFAWVTVRARADGYWIALPALAEDAGFDIRMELWHVGLDGTATREGVYPDPPAYQEIKGPSKLDGQGRLFEIGLDRANPEQFFHTIVRSSIAGESEVVYTVVDKPNVQVFDSYLVTGP